MNNNNGLAKSTARSNIAEAVRRSVETGGGLVQVQVGTVMADFPGGYLAHLGMEGYANINSNGTVDVRGECERGGKWHIRIWFLQ